ncbi:RHS repeat domain-containing protein [Neorhodopirellula pilleata]|uniref:tRNA nuclease WapA n=1 Tax=Neorhodopirellula pilleata TaxID=2714738 RepID=A0A5C6AVI0_9BACT|nr:tRNA nuclease WapA precursor [Neorhodopirellula pilleata]
MLCKSSSRRCPSSHRPRVRRRGRLPTACHPPTRNTFQNTKRQYQRNQQYSITALTNGGGSIVERYAYDAYGGMTVLDASLSPLTASAEGNRYTYTGREYDEDLGLYHYRARMYDADAGRFCSRDPIGFGDSWSLYLFVLSNPASLLDGTGNQATRPTVSITDGDGCSDGHKACINDIKRAIKRMLTLAVSSGRSCFTPSRPKPKEVKCRSQVDQAMLDMIDKMPITCSSAGSCGDGRYRAVSRGECVDKKDDGRNPRNSCADWQRDCTACPDSSIANSQIELCVSSPGSTGSLPPASNDIRVWCSDPRKRRDLARTIVHELAHHIVGGHTDDNDTDSLGRPDANELGANFIRNCGR